MLSLERRIGERIVIGEGENQVIIQLCSVEGDRALLGVVAGRQVSVVRGEVLAARRAAVLAAGEGAPPAEGGQWPCG